MLIENVLPARLPPILRRTTPLFTAKLRETVIPMPRGFEPKPLDLTGGVLRMFVKASPSAAEAIAFQADFTNDADATLGVATLRLTTVQTDRAGVWYVEFRVIYTSGARNTQNLWAGSTQLQFREALG